MSLRGKNIILIVTGGIAAYKSLDLARLFVKSGAKVYPIMTKSAEQFISKLSMETLCRESVSTELFSLGGDSSIDHIELAKKADLVVVAPATANIIGKCANGLAEDLASTVIVATKAPVLIAPAMNVNMYENNIVQDNISKLKDFGFTFVGPATGELACGDVGYGKLSDVEEIFSQAKYLLTYKDMVGKKVLVSAGGTREFIDPVRYITNASTGKMGLSIARDAFLRGASVTVVTTVKEHLKEPFSTVYVESAESMAKEIKDRVGISDILFMSAAVSDFTPMEVSKEKLKTTEKSLDLIPLKPTEDILLTLGKEKVDGNINATLVGFALETDNGVENALKKLVSKNLDFIVLNGAEAIGSVNNKVKIISKGGEVQDIPLLTKEELSKIIIDKALGCDFHKVKAKS